MGYGFLSMIRKWGFFLGVILCLASNSYAQQLVHYPSYWDNYLVHNLTASEHGISKPSFAQTHHYHWNLTCKPTEFLLFPSTSERPLPSTWVSSKTVTPYLNQISINGVGSYFMDIYALCPRS